MILRDRLAENRTALANERTLLAYARTALTLFVAGVTFIRFFGYLWTTILGWMLIPLGVFTMIKGVISHRKMSLLIRKEREDEPPG
jgi:putative membrane protein